MPHAVLGDDAAVLIAVGLSRISRIDFSSTVSAVILFIMCRQTFAVAFTLPRCWRSSLSICDTIGALSTAVDDAGDPFLGVYSSLTLQTLHVIHCPRAFASGTKCPSFGLRLGCFCFVGRNQQLLGLRVEVAGLLRGCRRCCTKKLLSKDTWHQRCQTFELEKLR